MVGGRSRKMGQKFHLKRISFSVLRPYIIWMREPSRVSFESKKYPYSKDVDYSKNPSLYEIGRGQQGVLICQPYKSELYPIWRFRTEEIAKESAQKIYQKFKQYLRKEDFVGADMAKKYLHMGFTRSRRYANHKSGKKWSKSGDSWEILPQEKDWETNEKARSARIFYSYWKMAREDSEYLSQKERFILLKSE